MHASIRGGHEWANQDEEKAASGEMFVDDLCRSCLVARVSRTVSVESDWSKT